MAILITGTGLSERQLLDDCGPDVLRELMDLASEGRLARRGL